MQTPRFPSNIMNTIHKGPCAKKVVTCILITPDGQRIVGVNDCENAQRKCPRESGEGYEKCTSICKQFGHAEIVALEKAGDLAKGSRAYILGHTHVCEDCQKALYAAGVKSISLGQPE